MAAGSSAARLIGDSKRDVNSKYAELVLHMRNMPRSKDDVEVLYPTDRSVCVLVKKVVILDRRLPAAIIKNECKHKVNNCGKEKGKITLKMRKLEDGMWIDRWSPRRELMGNDDGAAAATVSNNEPIVTTPSDDDDDDE